MDIGTIVLKPFDPAHLVDVHAALVATCRWFKVDPSGVSVAYAAHRELGPCLFIHLRLGDNAGFDFLTQVLPFDSSNPAEAAIGGGLSGYLNEAAEKRAGHEVSALRAWTVLFERRSAGWAVYKGFLHTLEASDAGDDGGPLERLRAKLAIKDGALLRQKLETADTRSVPITEAPPADIADMIRARLDESPK
jgi:hypothetical protein